jgi:lysozyme
MKRLLILIASFTLAASVIILLFTGPGRQVIYKILSAIRTKTITTDEPGKIWGLDLSHHQKVIEWEKLTMNKPAFIFFKATEGSTHTDTKYNEYVEQAR